MAVGFGSIPQEVIDYIRTIFADANDRVSRALTVQPATPEESLDTHLIGLLSTTPPMFFAQSKAGVVVESHWLGKRHMWRSWEVADIAFLITVRVAGMIAARKVTLLQMKRLYSEELAGAELERYDHELGIGRIFDKSERIVPLFPQRVFRFTPESKYAMVKAADRQVTVIDDYAKWKNIEVFYGLYNPMTVPFTGKYPWDYSTPLPSTNTVGCRVMPSTNVHGVLSKMQKGQSPSYADLTFAPFFEPDGVSGHGWRLENFIADEVLNCRRGMLFTGSFDQTFRELMYERTGPLASAIAITIDLAAD